MSKTYRNPAPTVDVIIEVAGCIVLIERKNEPRGWAIPGGFVDYGEPVEEAAVREAKEETGLDIKLKDLLYVYSDPSRDPRQHTMSTVFVAEAEGQPQGADDALRAELFALDALPAVLCFDHATILKHYLRFRASGQRPSPAEMLANRGACA
ncbi:MAG: NUDIX hydrolase [Bradymonadaceae bacterium]|nr:NUDIX hydrolase [Lujinxingiaceae bacterium]